jgi:hypothetical protein
VTRKTGIDETRRVRRVIRIVLAKCHDFERGRKVGRLCPKCGLKGFHYANVLTGVDAALAEVREQLMDLRGLALLDGLRQSTKKLGGAVSQICKEGRRLDAQFVSATLRAHRELFGYLVAARIGISLSPDAWSAFAMPAVALWHDRVAAVAYIPLHPQRNAHPGSRSRRLRQMHLLFPSGATPTNGGRNA